MIAKEGSVKTCPNVLVFNTFINDMDSKIETAVVKLANTSNNEYCRYCKGKDWNSELS